MIFSFLICLCGCNEKREPAKEIAYPVQTAQAFSQSTPIFLETLGHIESLNSIEIRSRIEGSLTGVFFEEGQEVKEGSLLFTIDSKPYQAALRQAEGILEENLANLALAQEKVKRYRTLAQDDYYSQIDYETLQTNFAAATAIVEQNRAEVDKARIDLDYCWIYAPIDGMLGILNVDYGNLVAAPNGNSDPLVKLNQMAPIYATFSVPEYQLPKIQKAYKKQVLAVQAAYNTFDEEPFSGTLAVLNNEVDPNTGMIKLRALFDNKDRSLWPGQFVRVRLILETIPEGIIIPFSAVQMTLTDPIVFVVRPDSTVEQRKVSLGQRDGENILVLSGVKAQEKVVVSGQMNLSSGVKVYESL